MIKQQYQEFKLFILAALLAASFISFSFYELRQVKKLLKQVQTGEKNLVCQLAKGLISIEPNKVENYINGTWYFTNGYSTNCKIKGD